MADQLELEALLDRTVIPSTNVETEVKCLLKVWPSLALRNAQAAPMETSLCLVFDCSASMLSGGKLDTAVESAKAIVDMIPESQTISLVAFQSKIYRLVDNAQATDTEKETIKNQIEEIRGMAGGSTNLTDAIKEGTRVFERCKTAAKVMILLTDGAADFPETAEKAAVAATNAGIQIFAVGIGAEYVADHLLKLVTPSNGTVFGESEVERIKATFTTLVSRIETFVATNARLTVSFNADVQAGLAYKASPEQAFLGNLALDDDRNAVFNVGNIERDKAYAFMFLAVAPQQSAGTIELCQVKLCYDVPTLGLIGETTEVTLEVGYSADRKATEILNGEVMEVFRRTSITQLAERFVDAYKADNHGETAKYLKILVRRYDEIGDSAMKNHYEDLLSDLQGRGVITNEMLNASVVASTVVAGGGELPQLVADNF
jgi:cytochrome c oxidase assembly protein Cox11